MTGSPAPPSERTARASDGCRLWYTLDAAPTDAPVLVCSNSLGTTHAMWDDQRAQLAGRVRFLCYDTRGHGRSEAPDEPYTVAQLATDVVAILNDARVERAAFCGLSLGSITGQYLGARHPQRLTALLLASTAAVVGTPQGWDERIARVRADGVGALRDGILERWFTPAFRSSHPAVVARIGAMLDRANPAGYAGCCAALRAWDGRDLVREIALPTLVVAGAHDAVTPPADGAALAAQLPDARLTTLDAAHLSNIERAAEFNAAIGELFARTKA